MSLGNQDRPATGTTPSPAGATPSEPIKAIKLRHPWRIVFAVVLILLLVWFVIDAAQREAYGWQYVGKYVFDKRISAAALVTLAADGLLDGHRRRPRPRPRRHAALAEPGGQVDRLALPLDLPRHTRCTCSSCSGACSR